MAFLHKVIFSNAQKIPEKGAIVYKENIITYKDLWKNIATLRNWLLDNFNHQARIGILLNNCPEVAYSLYGITSAGMICVPLDANIHSKNLSYIISDCKISLIITSSKYLSKLNEISNKQEIKILLVDNDGADEQSVLFLNDIFKVQSADKEKTNNNKIASKSKNITAIILYTTGTTGPKKGVMLSHQNLLSATKNINQLMRIGSWAVESLPMPLSHSFGFARLRCVFDVGGTVILENGLLRPERLLSNMLHYEANAISSVPAGFAILLDYYKDMFEKIGSQIKYIEIGSAFMRKNHKDMLVELCPDARICMHYGLTEASRSTFIEFHSEKGKLHTVGKPTPNVEIRIIDNDGNTLSVNETGEILVKGGMVMQGYWNKKKMTNESLTSGWLHTSDIGMIDTDGYLHLLGRKNEIINIGGLKVAPGEVEEILLKYNGIIESAVIGVKSADSISDETILAFIVTDNKSLSICKVEKFCLDNMEPYKVPAEFEIVETLPKTRSGKIQRHLLAKDSSERTIG